MAPFSSDLPGTINRLESTAMEPGAYIGCEIGGNSHSTYRSGILKVSFVYLHAH